MRKVIVFNMISTDGYFEGLNHTLDWHNIDGEFNDFAIAQLDEADTLVFGRRTYELMASFWSSEIAQKDDPAVSSIMNDADKLVFSNSLEHADWRNSTLLGKDAMKQFAALKEKPGKALLVLGSSNLCVGLLKEGLIDEIRLMVNPVVLGQGTPIFAGLAEPLRLHLIDSRSFHSGNVLLRYSIPKE
jgi:dihydrofolate reductase